MKKKKRNFIIKIFSLLLLGIISITLLGSWTYDQQNDTITSDNLFNATTEITYGNGSFTEDNGIYIISNNSTGISWKGFKDLLETLSNNTYTIEFITINSSYTGGLIQINNIFVYPNMPFTFTKDNNINGGWISNAVGNISFKVMLNVGSTILPYEPYGQTYINNTRYENLELDYEELYDNYQNLNDSYETLETNYNTLQNNYNALQQDLADMTELKEYYENKYNDTYNDYNALQQQYEDLLLRYSNLQSQIETLQDENANLKDQNKDLYNSLYGYDYFTNSNSSIVQTYSNDFYNNIVGSGSNLYYSWTLNTFNINDFIVDNRLSAYSLANSIYQDNKNGVSSGGNVTPWGSNLFTSLTLYPSYMVGSSATANYYYAKDFNIAIHYDNLSNVNVRVLLAQNTTDIITFNFNYVRYDIDDIVDNSINILFDENSTLYNYLVVAVEIEYVYDSTNDVYKGSDYIYSNGLTGEVNNAYKLGYDTGYGTASSIYSANIYNLNTEINSLNTTITYLRNEISSLQDRLADNLGWRPLFFAMADTPIEVVSKVLGFELFGVNLFQAFIGIITALAIIWLIRKIWK